MKFFIKKYLLLSKIAIYVLKQRMPQENMIFEFLEIEVE